MIATSDYILSVLGEGIVGGYTEIFFLGLCMCFVYFFFLVLGKSDSEALLYGLLDWANE